MLKKAKQILVSKEPDVLGFEFNSGALVCMYHETSGVGGAIHLTLGSKDSSSLREFIETMKVVSEGDGPEMLSKLIASQDEITALTKILHEYGIAVTSSCDLKGRKLQAYFYTDTGRLRVAEAAGPQELKKLSIAPSPSAPIPLPSKPMDLQKKIRVLVVDDSATIRKILRKVLSELHGFDVVGDVPNPIEADKFLAHHQVDVITLDINMPEMDGITYLETLKGKVHPPIVMISAINKDDATKTLRCFELGAVGYIEKPSSLADPNEAEHIRNMVKTAAQSQTRNPQSLKSVQSEIHYEKNHRYRDLILIGASTGGTQAITAILELFPPDCPPVVIVQHIPAVFSAAFAERLNHTSRLKVKEGAQGDLLEHGHAYVAPGGKQMKIVVTSRGLELEVNDDPPVNRHQPSVDYLWNEVVNLPKSYRIVAALLTGMGADGAKGLKKIKDKGFHTIAESEETCVVFGMPREAIKLGAASEVSPLHQVPHKLFRALEKP